MLASEISIRSPPPSMHAATLYPPFATTSVTPNLYNPPVIRDHLSYASPPSRSLPAISAASASATLPSLASPRSARTTASATTAAVFSASAPLPVTTSSPWAFTNRHHPGGGSAYDRHYVPTSAPISPPSSSATRGALTSPRPSHPHAHAHATQYLSPHGLTSSLFPVSPTSPNHRLTTVASSTSSTSAPSASPQSYGARGAADGPVQLSGSTRFITGVAGGAASSPRSLHMDRSMVPPKYPGSSFLIDQSLPSVTGPRIDELPEYVSNGLVHRAAPATAGRSPRGGSAASGSSSSMVASRALPGEATAEAVGGGDSRVATGFGLDGSCRRRQCFITRFQAHSIANRYRDRTQSAYA